MHLNEVLGIAERAASNVNLKSFQVTKIEFLYCLLAYILSQNPRTTLYKIFAIYM